MGTAAQTSLGFLVGVCPLLEDVDCFRDCWLDGDPHQASVFNGADCFVAAEGNHGSIPDEARPDDCVQLTGDEDDQQGGSLAAEALPAYPGFQCAGVGLWAGVEDSGNNQTGDVVHGHQNDEGLQSSIPAAEVRGDRAANNANDGRVELLSC